MAATPETTQLDTYKPPAAATAAGFKTAEWLTMRNLYHGAKPESVIAIWHYCKARKLDPFKKPVHIVPMRVKEGGEWKTRDVILPGIYEYRITAHRTGEYRGHEKPQYGPLAKFAGVEAPEWCDYVAYRGVAGSPRPTWAEFPVTAWFKEVVTRKADGQANDRWTDAPRQMLTKVAEAWALREAFPEEFGGTSTAEEMYGRVIDDGQAVVEPTRPLPPKPEQFDQWLTDLEATCDEGVEAFEKAWAASSQDKREYLAALDPSRVESLTARADAVRGETIANG